MNFLSLRFETFLQDPMLLIGAGLLILGPIIFLVALWKFLTFDKYDHKAFMVPSDDEKSNELGSLDIISETPTEPTIPPQPELTPVEPAPLPADAEQMVPLQTPPSPPAHAEVPLMERTVVLPPGVADVQAQIDILVTQIKQLNKKVSEVEVQLESVQSTNQSKLEPSELKEGPQNPQDFLQKLLKLAEHVIVLEKEVAKLKGLPAAGAATPVKKATPQATASSQPKSPIMPI